MGLKRRLLGPIAVAVLGLVSTACEPAKPQMELKLDVSPSGTLEVLTNVITLNVRVTCTRSTFVPLRARFPVTTNGVTYQIPLVSASNDAIEQTVHCSSPAFPNGNTWPTQWRVNPGTSISKVPPNPLPITMTGKTLSSGDVTEPIDYAVA